MAKEIGVVLKKIDGRGFKAYKELLGARERVGDVLVEVVKVQGDPYAPPSVVKLEALTDAPQWALDYPVALADWILRRLHRELKRVSRRVGEGHSGLVAVPRPGPVMLRRSSLTVEGRRVVARIWVGLPSKRRKVLGYEAEELLLVKLPKAFESAISWRSSVEFLRAHVHAWRLQEELRSSLPRYGLVSFVGDGSILPRRCGGCEDPLPGAVPFESPPSLRVEIELPCGEVVTGMGIRRGVTVVVGTAFQGKTTLIEAIAAGVWNHIPGDGREKVVTVRSAFYVRSEDGRRVACVDVSPMVIGLLGVENTECFSTENASGATSAAASFQEAVELGAELVILDEDTVATNFLYYDERVQGVVPRRTVIPLAELAKSVKEADISIVVASSGSLPLMAAADTVILMDEFRARDVTEEVRKLVERHGLPAPGTTYRRPPRRVVVRARPLLKPKVRGGVLTAKNLEPPLNLKLNLHIAEEGQLATLAAVAARLDKLFVGRELAVAAAAVEKALAEGRFEEVAGREPGPAYSEVRAIDVAYMVNRLPGLKVVSRKASSPRSPP